jgi:hypothetical protein
MSSAINAQSVLKTLAALESQIAALKAQLGAPSAPVKGAKKELSAAALEARRSSPWIVFTGRVRALLKTAGATGGIETQMFCSSLKDTTPIGLDGKADYSVWSDADILARFGSWTRPEVSKQAAAKSSASVASGDDADGAAAEKPKKERKNPWAGLSEEERAAKIAKMQAGRKAKKAGSEEAAEASDGDAAPAAPAPSAPASVAGSESSGKKKRGPWSEETKAKAAAKRAAKKEASADVSVAAGGGAAAAPASPMAAALKVPLPPSDDEEDAFKRILFKGQSYLVNSSGWCYYRESDGTQGRWAGIFKRGPPPTLDASVPEPEADEEVFGDDE